MQTHKIISVEIVSGKMLNPHWSNDMQVVTTDKGIFVDNVKNAQFGVTGANPGFNWEDEKGKQVGNVRIFPYSGNGGYDGWINKQ